MSNPIVINLDTQGRLNTGDIIVWVGGKWKAVSKAEYLSELTAELRAANEKLTADINTLKDKINEIEANNAEFKAQLNKKLKEHHDALNVLIGV